jgi:hypothetical protein
MNEARKFAFGKERGSLVLKGADQAHALVCLEQFVFAEFSHCVFTSL